MAKNKSKELKVPVKYVVGIIVIAFMAYGAFLYTAQEDVVPIVKKTVSTAGTTPTVTEAPPARTATITPVATPPPVPKVTTASTPKVTEATPPPTPLGTVQPTLTAVNKITAPATPMPTPTPVGTPVLSFATKNPVITRIEWYFLDVPSPIHYTKLTDAFPKNAFGFVRVYYRSEYGTKYIGKFDIEVRENVPIPIVTDKTIFTNPQTISIDSTMPETYLDTGFQAPSSNSIFVRINGNAGYIFDLSGSERAVFPGAEIQVK